MRSRFLDFLRTLPSSLPIGWARSLGAGLALLSATHAQAQNVNGVADANGDGLDTHLFRPAPDSKGFFHTNGSTIMGANDVSFGLVLDYGHSLLRVKEGGQRLPRLIEHSMQGTLFLNYGIGYVGSVGLSIPVNLMVGQQQVDGAGNALFPNRWSNEQLRSQTVGAPAVHGKVRILRVERGFGLAASLQAGLPVSDAPKNAGADPTFFAWPQIIAEKRFGATGWLKVGANAGFRFHPASSTELELERGVFRDGSRATYGLGISARVAEPLDLVADTYGTYLVSNADSGVKLSNEVVGGIKLFVERNSFLILGAGGRYTDGFEAATFRGFIGVVFEPSIGDRDGDGINDDIDKCPDQPEDYDGFEDEDGCPDPDNDKDGIPDIKDRCPDEPEDKDGDEDDDGCPENNDGDRDGDRIPDSRDKCPDDPEDYDGFEDKDGCPEPDNDKDGIPDKKDKCPNDPEDKDGFEDEDGCPEPDNDNDRIPDVEDKCPNQPENYNGFQDEDGCPDKGDVSVGEGGLTILKKISFKRDSAEILAESNDILEQIAGTIKGHPEFLLMEVAGHADERAPDQYNLALTQKRVDAVVAALITRGVDRSRLRSKGYGEYCPEDDGHDEDAWEKNRRVEFKIVKSRDPGPAPQLGCANATAHGVKPDPIP
jgi:OmpA-OmpF porin, OOP family